MSENPWRQIYDCIGEAAALEMLAEEAAELAAAASKAARIVRGDNPARTELSYAFRDVFDELVDVHNAEDVWLAGSTETVPFDELQKFKMVRWYDSLFKEENDA